MNTYSYNDESEKMKQRADGFTDIYNAYFDYNLNDEAITDQVTQSFFQCMYLSRRKLYENGITIHYATEQIGKVELENPIFSSPSDTKTYKKKFKVTKNYVKNGTVIDIEKKKMVAISNVTRPVGDEEDVVCPNCGHAGKLSSYIDGCDYCGSKFRISNFKEQISSFGFYDDVKKSSSLFKRLLKFIAILIPIFIATIALSFVGLLISTFVGADGQSSFTIGMCFLLSYYIVPMLFVILLIVGLVFGIVWNKFLAYAYKRVDNSQALNELLQAYPSFSPDEFASDLEYKLRNIHFADNAREVNVFSNIDLSEAVAKYSNVIECDLLKIKVLGVEISRDMCHIRVKSKLKLTKVVNDKIKTETENVIMIVSYNSTTLTTKHKDIEMYTCNGCGSTISLLNGGVCEKCGNKLDYSKYSFIIQTYYSNYKEQINNVFVKMGNQKEMNIKIKVKLVFVGCIVGALLIATTWMKLSIGDYIKMLFHYNEYSEKVVEEFDKFDTLSERYDEFTVAEDEYKDMVRECEYEYKDEDLYLLDEYKSYLKEEGFVTKYDEDGDLAYYKNTPISEEFSFNVFVKLTIKVEDGKIIIKYEMDDDDDDVI